MVIKRDFTFGEWEHIDPELFICADEQGYSFIFEGRIHFDLLVVMDLWDIQIEEDEKCVKV